ncbi:MAG: hypothetical protein ACR2J8_14745, partial [Thermomicrobiales bacterium]
MESNTPRDQGNPESSRPPRQSGGDHHSGGRAPAPTSAGRPVDDGRRRKSTSRYTGWGDGVDRVWCTARHHHPAQFFPVHSRIAATRPVVVVDQRDGEVLHCDGEHWG